MRINLTEKAFWEDQWPSRIDEQGRTIPRIWKRTDRPDPDKDHTITRFDGRKVSLVDEHGNWRWPWWYRIPGWVACYTDSFESALVLVNRYWQEEWIMKHFLHSKIGHSHVDYPWLDDVKFADYKPLGVYCR